MAKAKSSSPLSKFKKRVPKKRKGIHSKKKASRSKHSKNYLKKKVGQGK